MTPRQILEKWIDTLNRADVHFKYFIKSLNRNQIEPPICFRYIDYQNLNYAQSRLVS